jgi:hypothetical protein
MNDFAERNGILDTGGSLADAMNANVIGYYTDAAGNRLTGLPPIGSVGYVPDDAIGIEAFAVITAPTYFGGIFGLDGMPLQAEAAVHFESACSSGDCVLPIAIHAMGFGDDPDDDDPDAPLVPIFQEGSCYNLWDGEGPGAFGWLNWSIQEASCPEEVGDDCSADCLSYNMDPDFCSRNGDLKIEVGMEAGGTSGVKNANMVRGWLDYYAGRHDDVVKPVQIVVYDAINNPGGCGKLENGTIQGQTYSVAGLAAFEITGYRLSKGAGFVEWDRPGFPNPYEDCLDYPGECVLIDEETGAPIPCDWETGDYNRITGIAVPYTGGDAGSCQAVGNLMAPRLSR